MMYTFDQKIHDFYIFLNIINLPLFVLLLIYSGSIRYLIFLYSILWVCDLMINCQYQRVVFLLPVPSSLACHCQCNVSQAQVENKNVLKLF